MGLMKPLTYDERKKIEELLRKGATNSQKVGHVISLALESIVYWKK